MPIAEINDILTVPDAAKELGKPKMTLYRWIDAGKITCVRLGGVLFIPRKELERLKKEKEAIA